MESIFTGWKFVSQRLVEQVKEETKQEGKPKIRRDKR
jgi:hypothetical protein